MKKNLIILCLSCLILFGLTGYGLFKQQERAYTVTGTAEQMVLLQNAIDASTLPHNQVVELQKWLIPQLYKQDKEFAKQDSISKAKTK